MEPKPKRIPTNNISVLVQHPWVLGSGDFDKAVVVSFARFVFVRARAFFEAGRRSVEWRPRGNHSGPRSGTASGNNGAGSDTNNPKFRAKSVMLLDQMGEDKQTSVWLKRVEEMYGYQYDCKMGGMGSNTTTTIATTSAKRSTCCGAGRVFWTVDRGSEPTVVLGYCGDPLECWGAVVLWCRGRRLFVSAFRKLLMSEFVDLANLTRLRRVFSVPSHQVLEEKARCSPPKTPRLHPTVTNPQQSWGLLSRFVPSHHVTVVCWGFFEYPMCVS